MRVPSVLVSAAKRGVAALQTKEDTMRVTRRRPADDLGSERHTRRTSKPKRHDGNGVPKLGLWECGIGSGWK
ncbi:hypothetical protein MPSYJ_54510 [Mycolicibacterium psychrotolerans]|uniref:Uncharacterized protein n=1 Tax=Mycolicibacterium psychrotolerans TaxID=216929 RepID=A0A7I7MJL5_9MYCO|nr:hypothetical protein MPSYJ_54510 [Mycolicibacterium psychrotolerans]